MRLFHVIVCALMVSGLSVVAWGTPYGNDSSSDYYIPQKLSEIDVFVGGNPNAQQGLVLELSSSDGDGGVYAGTISASIASNFDAKLSVELFGCELTGQWDVSINSSVYLTPGQPQKYEISMLGMGVPQEDLSMIVHGEPVGVIRLMVCPTMEYSPFVPLTDRPTPEFPYFFVDQASSNPDPYRTYLSCACPGDEIAGNNVKLVPAGPGHIPGKTQWRITNISVREDGTRLVAIKIEPLDILQLPGGGTKIKIGELLINDQLYREVCVNAGFYIQHVGREEMKIHGHWPRNFIVVDDDAPSDPGPNDPNLSDPNEDGSPLRPFDRIQEAINGGGWTVLVRKGTYHECIEFVERAVTVVSEVGPSETIINGNGYGPVVRFIGTRWGRSSSLEGFTITNGTTANDGLGGGIVVSDSSPTIKRNIVTGNHTDDCGGGIYVFGESYPVITGNVILTNEAGSAGGGIALQHGSLAMIKNNLIIGNQALLGEGGGFYIDQSSSELVNNTICNNKATGSGGGIYSVGEGQAMLMNNIIVNNLAEAFGGGVSSNNSSLLLSYNDVWGNSALLGNADYDGVEPGLGGFSSDPLFVDMYYLSQIAAGQEFTSPCVDAGSDLVEALYLYTVSTRVDGVFDTDVVDLGFHWDPDTGPLPEDIKHLLEDDTAN